MAKPKHELTESETEDASGSSGSEPSTPVNGGDDHRLSGYEKQRLSRIAENRKRMEALGLVKMASSLMGSAKSAGNMKKKEKDKVGKKNDDDDYKPGEEDEHMESSGSEDWVGDDGKEEDDEDYVGGKASGSRRNKLKNKCLKPKKKASGHISHYIDDDDALKQAIALSLQDSVEVSNARVLNPIGNERNIKAKIQEDVGKRKKTKPFASRLQMTEDELVVNFYLFDDDWKGGITINDLRRIAIAHDFIWTDKELTDMIHCFDKDGDGKLSLDDFRSIVGRCNMIRETGTS